VAAVQSMEEASNSHILQLEASRAEALSALHRTYSTRLESAEAAKQRVAEEMEQHFADRIRVANEQRETALREAEERAQELLRQEREKHNQSMHSLELSFTVRTVVVAFTQLRYKGFLVVALGHLTGVYPMLGSLVYRRCIFLYLCLAY
jgi:hypothetical protein